MAAKRLKHTKQRSSVMSRRRQAAMVTQQKTQIAIKQSLVQKKA